MSPTSKSMRRALRQWTVPPLVTFHITACGGHVGNSEKEDSGGPADSAVGRDGPTDVGSGTGSSRRPGSEGGETGSAPDGGAGCFLQYNSSTLTLANGDETTPSECCYAPGGPNACDMAATCSAASGGGCCILYSTATDGFTACCYYEYDVMPGDSACAALVESDH